MPQDHPGPSRRHPRDNITIFIIDRAQSRVPNPLRPLAALVAFAVATFAPGLMLDSIVLHAAALILIATLSAITLVNINGQGRTIDEARALLDDLEHGGDRP